MVVVNENILMTTQSNLYIKKGIKTTSTGENWGVNDYHQINRSGTLLVCSAFGRLSLIFRYLSPALGSNCMEGHVVVDKISEHHLVDLGPFQIGWHCSQDGCEQATHPFCRCLEAFAWGGQCLLQSFTNYRDCLESFSPWDCLERFLHGVVGVICNHLLVSWHCL